MVKKLPFSEFKSIYSRVPRLCVEVIITNENGVLLTKRIIPPSKGYWHFPGGTVLLGESLRMAVKRVAREEVGLEVEVIKCLGTIEFSLKSVEFGQVISIPFLVKIVGGELKGSEQATELKFFKKIPQKTVRGHLDFCSKELGFDAM
ncbi:MAG: NUDIX domain-containing protein [bacterium]|nr:NUDIX domain-containing protein [bacterium]